MKHPGQHVGDPTPDSPAVVLSSPHYRMVDSHNFGMTVRLTVLHRGTETFWQTNYGMFSDRLGAIWYRVQPHAVTTIEYRRVP